MDQEKKSGAGQVIILFFLALGVFATLDRIDKLETKLQQLKDMVEEGMRR